MPSIRKKSKGSENLVAQLGVLLAGHGADRRAALASCATSRVFIPWDNGTKYIRHSRQIRCHDHTICLALYLVPSIRKKSKGSENPGSATRIVLLAGHGADRRAALASCATSRVFIPWDNGTKYIRHSRQIRCHDHTICLALYLVPSIRKKSKGI